MPSSFMENSPADLNFHLPVWSFMSKLISSTKRLSRPSNDARQQSSARKNDARVPRLFFQTFVT
jgi:hypothetical protein